MFIRKSVKLILDIIAPRYCAGCQKSEETLCSVCSVASFKQGASCVFCNFRNNTGRICRQCRKIYEPRFEKVLWAGEYKNFLKSAILELKYKKRKELVGPLAEFLHKKFTEFYSKSKKENFVIIPIPMHPKKEHERGFNQAGLLACEFSKLSGIQLLTDPLIKARETKTQVETKNKEERINNLDGAFSVHDPSLAWVKFGDKTIILVDDVATTGATFIHASHALQKSGFTKIICLAIAHGYG